MRAGSLSAAASRDRAERVGAWRQWPAHRQARVYLEAVGVVIVLLSLVGAVVSWWRYVAGVRPARSGAGTWLLRARGRCAGGRPDGGCSPARVARGGVAMRDLVTSPSCPKASVTTRRFSLALGTLGARGAGSRRSGKDANEDG